jgi:hypothetical protein
MHPPRAVERRRSQPSQSDPARPLFVLLPILSLTLGLAAILVSYFKGDVFILSIPLGIAAFLVGIYSYRNLPQGKRSLAAVAIWLIPIATAASVGYFVYGTFSDVHTIQSATKVDLQTVVAAYELNAVAADKDFKDKAMLVSGTIMDIDHLPSGVHFIGIASGDALAA